MLILDSDGEVVNGRQTCNSSQVYDVQSLRCEWQDGAKNAALRRDLHLACASKL